MKIRIKFSKQGSMKFVGHLDLMRYFQKAIRRSQIDICYSGGFSPHQIMSFAAPLGVGVTSNGEYMDIRVNTSGTSDQMILQLNKSMADGVRILSWKNLGDAGKNAMSVAAAADYTLAFRQGYEPEDLKEARTNFIDFINRDLIPIMKKTKKSEREIDIRPLIHEAVWINDRIFLNLSSGSVNNLKPDLVMQAFYDAYGLSLTPYTFQIQREEMYAWDVDQPDTLVPLEELGENIE